MSGSQGLRPQIKWKGNVMRNLLAALVTGSALSMAASAAMADGLPGGYRDCCHTANFGGFYVGVHGGYGVADPLSATLYDDNFLGEALHVNNPRGALRGVHGGGHVQIGEASCAAGGRGAVGGC